VCGCDGFAGSAAALVLTATFACAVTALCVLTLTLATPPTLTLALPVPTCALTETVGPAANVVVTPKVRKAMARPMTDAVIATTLRIEDMSNPPWCVLRTPRVQNVCVTPTHATFRTMHKRASCEDAD